MIENRNDQQFGQTRSGQPQNLVGSQQGSQRRDEHSSPDDFDELEDDEMEDDEMISRVDTEDDMDILDEDENPQMNRQDM